MDEELNWGKPDGFLYGLPVYFTEKSVTPDEAKELLGYAPAFQPPLVEVRNHDKRTPLHVAVVTGLQMLAEQNNTRCPQHKITALSFTERTKDALYRWCGRRVGELIKEPKVYTDADRAIALGGVPVSLHVSRTEIGCYFKALLIAAIDGKRCLQFLDDGSCQEINYR